MDDRPSILVIIWRLSCFVIALPFRLVWYVAQDLRNVIIPVCIYKLRRHEDSPQEDKQQ